MNYKAIIFDLDNTLLNYSVSELKSMQRTVQEHGLIHKNLFTWDDFWSLFSKINIGLLERKKRERQQYLSSVGVFFPGYS